MTSTGSSDRSAMTIVTAEPVYTSSPARTALPKPPGSVRFTTRRDGFPAASSCATRRVSSLLLSLTTMISNRIDSRSSARASPATVGGRFPCSLWAGMMIDNSGPDCALTGAPFAHRAMSPRMAGARGSRASRSGPAARSGCRRPSAAFPRSAQRPGSRRPGAQRRRGFRS